MLESIGYVPDLARWALAADLRVGRVLGIRRGLASVLTEHGPVDAGYGGHLLGAIAADVSATPSVGDWVVLRDWPDGRVTLERWVPRRSVLVRAIGGHAPGEIAMAANIDLVAIVFAADAAHLHPITPIVEMARASGARPVLVLTRCDRVVDAPGVARALGTSGACDVLLTSAVTGEGVPSVVALMAGRLTMALVAAPEQGKATLVRALVGDLAVRRATNHQLHVLPAGGALIDTPSLRAVA